MDPQPEPSKLHQVIPNELISEIFDWASRDRLHRFPLVLGLVSRLWRDISLSTPSLWTHLSLEIGGPVSGSDERNYKGHTFTMQHAASVMAWLDRAKSLPCDLTMVVASKYRNPDVVDLPYLRRGFEYLLRRLVATHGHHLKRLKLTLPDIFIENLAGQVPMSMPLLTDVDITGMPNANLEYSQNIFFLPWRRSKEVTLNLGDPMYTMKILSKCLRAVFLSICTKTPSDHGLETIHTKRYSATMLRDLRQLSLSCEPRGLKMFSRLCLPALTQLAISRDDAVERDEDANIPSFLNGLFRRRGRFQLTSLTISWMKFRPAEFFTFLKTQPRIVRLSIAHCAFLSGSTLDRLTIKDTTTTEHPDNLLPQLEEIHLKEARFAEQFDSGILAAFVESRRQETSKASKLHVVSIHIDESLAQGLDDKVLERYRALDEEGISLRVPGHHSDHHEHHLTTPTASAAH